MEIWKLIFHKEINYVSLYKQVQTWIMEIKWSGNPNLATLFIGGFRKWYQSISRPEKRGYTDF